MGAGELRKHVLQYRLSVSKTTRFTKWFNIKKKKVYYYPLEANMVKACYNKARR